MPIRILPRRSLRRGLTSTLRGFLVSGAASGLMLIAAAALAIIVANSPLGGAYAAILARAVGPLSIAHWINDALMALFFLLVGLEIKRELIDGDLRRWSDRWLPIVAAGAGMALPAAIYLAIAGPVPGLARGWAIPAATDIAFAIAVLALLGRRAPASLKLLLVTIAIVDDLGAVAIIALGYTAHVDPGALAAAAGLWAAMLWLNRRGIVALPPYLLLAVLLWVAIHRSGVHATVAGVLTAFAIPLRASPGVPDDVTSPLHRLEHALSPLVGFGIVPLFGFANAGVSFAGIGVAQLLAPLPLGIAAALMIGKQIGVYAAIRLAVACGIARRPSYASWWQLWGMCLLCGIGFTMSLFIGGLAFADPLRLDEVRIGVLGGSLLSALAGAAVLCFAPDRRKR